MKRPVLWGIASLASIGYLGAMVVTGALPELRSHVKFEARGVTTVVPERIDRLEIEREGMRLVLARTPTGGWSRKGGEALAATVADKVSIAVQYMHTAAPVRFMTAEETSGSAPAAFGLERPRLSVALYAGSQRVLLGHFGAHNPADMLPTGAGNPVLQVLLATGQPKLSSMTRRMASERLSPPVQTSRSEISSLPARHRRQAVRQHLGRLQ